MDWVLAVDVAFPTSNTSFAYAFAGVCPDVELNCPKDESLVEICSASPDVVVAMTAWPAALKDRLVPAANVPAVIAEAMAICKSAMVEDAPAVKENVWPVEASVIEVIEPASKAVLVFKGVAADPRAEVAEFDGNGCVSTAARFATLLLLVLVLAELIASKEGSVIDTVMLDAAFAGPAGIEKKS